MKLVLYKCGIMRPEAVILIAATVLIFTEGTRCSRTYTHIAKHRNKPREVRGFKPEYLSTAIGFGKRESISGNPKRTGHEDIIIMPLLHETPQSFPVEWFTRELRRNPDLAKKITEKFIDDDHNGKLSAAELSKSTRTISTQ